MVAYLQSTGRSELAALATDHRADLVADPEVEADPGKFFDEVVEIDLSALETGLVGPHTPDLLHVMSKMSEDAKANDYPTKLTAALIGSCTNSSYEDLGKAANIARQATAKGVKPKVPFFVSPGSNAVQDTTRRDGQLEALEKLGATILSNSCGPCIGQWQRTDGHEKGKNSIVSSFNRNFPGRNDGNRETLSFLGSPELVTALALAGRLDFDPVSDTLEDSNGQPFRLEPPVADELPAAGFAAGTGGYVPPADGPASVDVVVAPDSERIAILEPFPAPSLEEDFNDLPVLLKATGKTTTDHISPAGPWLRYRGHLDKISNNMFLGAVNAWTENPGTCKKDGETEARPCNEVARDYKSEGTGWVVVGDHNYGEGSSREHAAMCPRHLGCRAVIVRSFARIHQTNLKKQGVLPLTFVDASDYDKVQEGDRVSLSGLDTLAPGSKVSCTIAHKGGGEDVVTLAHTLTEEQVEWFRQGSALNVIRKNQRSKS